MVTPEQGVGGGTANAGRVMVSASVVVRVADLPVPMMAKVVDAAGEVAEALSVRADAPPAVTEAGLQDAVTPLGRPDAEKVMVSMDPAMTAVETVVVVE